ncbi:MAG TPA: hemolysin family protein [Candidatus Acidoferrales bacterium]|nr:hemolysin family protein [Candidatus Acidoferrales bacterium]
MGMLFYTLAVLALGAGLTVFSYLDRVYRELGRVTTGRLHANLEIFEAEIEPRLGMDRRRGALTFNLLANLWLVVVAVETARGVIRFVPAAGEALVELLVFLLLEVMLAMHFVPYLLLTRANSRWLVPLLPVLRAFVLVIWPLRMLLELAISVAHISEEEEPTAAQAQQEGIEALVEAAQEGGILVGDQAQLIEQVVEFSDKRVREVMTPRPDIVAIPATATVEQLRRLVVETKFSRIPVYDRGLDDIIGIVFARDLLQIPPGEGARSTVRELVRPALFVPETKLGSQLLKEMQLKNQQMAIAVDEYGSLAGLVTVEDLVEEIVGEIGEEDRLPVPDVVREVDGSLVLRGSVSLEKVQELFGVKFDAAAEEGATTVAGLLNTLAAHVPVPGERIDYNGLRFEVLEANQRKVLRLRVRRHAAAGVSS